MEPDYQDYATSSDYCIHGTYLGSWAGPDYMCGACESGADIGVTYLTYDVRLRVLNEDRSLRYEGSKMGSYWHVEDARDKVRELVDEWAEYTTEKPTTTLADDEYRTELVLDKGNEPLIGVFYIETRESGGWFTTKEYEEFKSEGVDHTVTHGKELVCTDTP